MEHTRYSWVVKLVCDVIVCISLLVANVASWEESVFKCTWTRLGSRLPWNSLWVPFSLFALDAESAMVRGLHKRIRWSVWTRWRASMPRGMMDEEWGSTAHPLFIYRGHDFLFVSRKTRFQHSVQPNSPLPCTQVQIFSASKTSKLPILQIW